MTDGTLESRLARIEQRVDDLDERVGNLTPLVANVAVLAEQIKTVNRTLTVIDRNLEQFAKQAQADREAVHEQEARRRRDRATTRQWAIGILTTILVSALLAAATLAAIFH